MYTISKKGRTSKGFRALCNLVKLRLEKIFNKLISLRLVDFCEDFQCPISLKMTNLRTVKHFY